MIYGYARVSTTGQKEHGNSLDDQIKKLTAAGAEKVYSDAFTGKTMNRPEFNKLMEALQAGDTLICTKLDRFARTAAEGVQMVQELMNKGIVVDILNMGKADNTPMGKLMVTMLFVASPEEDSPPRTDSTEPPLMNTVFFSALPDSEPPPYTFHCTVPPLMDTVFFSALPE